MRAPSTPKVRANEPPLFISVVAPVYNEEESIAQFCSRTCAVLEGCASRWELILIDDGSTDRSAPIIEQLHEHNPNIKSVIFSRNFGHAAAISAGLDCAAGEVVVVMDSDLQDPPEVITLFLEKWREGCQVVYGVRRKRKEGAVKRSAYWLFYRIFKLLSALDMPLDAGDFALLDRRVVLHLRALPERNRFLRGLRSYVGYRQCGVLYEREARFAGSPKYSFRTLMRLAFDGIFSFSYVPLRLATALGFVVAAAALIGMLLLLVLRLTHGIIEASGFTTVILAVLFMGSVQLVCIGILGEYIGRIYDETKKRPVYIIARTLGTVEQQAQEQK